MAVEREGVELIVQGDSQYFATLTRAADANDKLAAAAAQGAAVIASANTAALQSIETSAARLTVTYDAQAKAAEEAARAEQYAIESAQAARVAAYEGSIQQAAELRQVNRDYAEYVIGLEKNVADAYDAATAKILIDAARQKQALDSLRGSGVLPNQSSFTEQVKQPNISSSEELLATPKLNQMLFEQRQAAEQAAAAHALKTVRINQQAQAEQQATGTGLTFIGAISGIHAAVNQLNIPIANSIGNILLLANSFSAMGPAGAAFGAAVGIALAGVNQLYEAFQRVISITEETAATLVKVAAAGAAAFTAFLAAGVRGASEIQSALTIVQGVTGATGDQVTKLQEKVLEVSNTFGVSGKDVAEAAQLYVKAGGTIEGAMNGALKSVSQLKLIAPNLGTEEATNAIITLSNQFKLSSSQAADAIVQLSKTSTYNFNQIVEGLRQVGPVAAQLGVPIQDVIATMALLSRQGLTATQAGTQLRQMFIDLENPSVRAAAELNRVNLSLFDTQGRVRPLIDVIGGLSRAYGQLAKDEGSETAQSQAQGLALDFKSRAQIAANILAQDGVQAFAQLKNTIGDISAEELANLVLNTTASQLKILETNAQNAATIIAGPLNVALGAATRSVNTFLQSLASSGTLNTIAQGLATVLTGAGFDKFEQQLTSVTQNKEIIDFANQLIAVFLAVRSAVADNILPALQNLGSTLSNIASNADYNQFFSGLAGAIVEVSRVVAGAISSFALFIDGLVKGGPQVQAAQNFLNGLATVVAGSLVTSFATVAVPLVVAIDLIAKIGETANAQTPGLNALILKMADLATIAQNVALIVGNALRIIGEGFAADFEAFEAFHSAEGLNFSDASEHAQNYAQHLSNIGKATVDIATDFSKLGQVPSGEIEKIKTIQDQIIGQAGAIKQLADSGGLATPEGIARYHQLSDGLTRLQDQLVEHQKTLETIGGPGVQGLIALSGAANTLADDYEKIKAAAAQGLDLSELIAKAKQDSDGLSAYIIDNAQKVGQSLIQLGTPTEAGVVTPAGGAKTPKRTQEEIAQDAALKSQESFEARITSTEQEAADRDININLQRANRTETIYDSLYRRLEELAQTEADREVEINNQHNARLEETTQDRGRKEQFDDSRRNVEQYFQYVDEQVQLSEQYQERVRQEGRQDLERNFNVQQEIAQRAFDQSQQLADRAFARQQQRDETTFSRRQSQVERDFQQSLDTETRKHNLAEELAKASTPQERTNIQQRYNQGEQDRKFSEAQSERLRLFQQQQQDQATNFRNQEDDAGYARRIQQSVTEFDNKLQAQKQSTDYQRGLDDAEFTNKQQKEIQDFNNKISRTNFLHSLDIANQKDSYDYADAREEQHFNQQILDLQYTQNRQLQSALQQAQDQIGSADREQQKALLENVQQKLKNEANTAQTLVDALTSQLRERASPLAEQELAQAQTQLQGYKDALTQVNQQLETMTASSSDLAALLANPQLEALIKNSGPQQAPFNYTPPAPQPYLQLPTLSPYQFTPSNVSPYNLLPAGTGAVAPGMNQQQFSQAYSRGFQEGLSNYTGAPLPVRVTNQPTVIQPGAPGLYPTNAPPANPGTITQGYRG